MISGEATREDKKECKERESKKKASRDVEGVGKCDGGGAPPLSLVWVFWRLGACSTKCQKEQATYLMYCAYLTK